MLGWLLGSNTARAARCVATHEPKSESPKIDGGLIRNESPVDEGPVKVGDNLCLAFCDLAEAERDSTTS